jgi:hypothetical protein
MHSKGLFLISASGISDRFRARLMLAQTRVDIETPGLRETIA